MMVKFADNFLVINIEQPIAPVESFSFDFKCEYWKLVIVLIALNNNQATLNAANTLAKFALYFILHQFYPFNIYFYFIYYVYVLYGIY